LGTLLLKRLIAYARSHGIRAFLAVVHASNGRMMRLVRNTGLPIENRGMESGVWEFKLALEPEAGPQRTLVGADHRTNRGAGIG
jgi:hypothetical protein